MQQVRARPILARRRRDPLRFHRDTRRSTHSNSASRPSTQRQSRTPRALAGRWSNVTVQDRDALNPYEASTDLDISDTPNSTASCSTKARANRSRPRASSGTSAPSVTTRSRGHLTRRGDGRHLGEPQWCSPTRSSPTDGASPIAHGLW